jgi:predicted nucleic acid-binding Zn ribbon protein
MSAANLVKYFSCRASTSECDVVQTLTDTFLSIGAGGNVEEALIGLGVLHNGSGFSVHCQHHRTFRLFELFHEFTGRPAKRRQRFGYHW